MQKLFEKMSCDGIFKELKFKCIFDPFSCDVLKFQFVTWYIFWQNYFKSNSRKSSRKNRIKNEIKFESEILSNPGLCLVQISHFLIFLLLQALCSNFDSFGNQLQLAWLKNYFSISKLVFKRNFGEKWAILEWNWRWKSI